VEWELPTLPEHLRSPRFFSEVFVCHCDQLHILAIVFSALLRNTNMINPLVSSNFFDIFSYLL
jgi:hypothetical protein